MAATTGLGLSSTRAITVFKMGSSNARGVPNSRTSAPPEKARSEPVNTMAVMASSALVCSRNCTIACRKAKLRPLTGGLLMVMNATLFWSSYCTAYHIAAQLKIDNTLFIEYTQYYLHTG